MNKFQRLEDYVMDKAKKEYDDADEKHQTQYSMIADSITADDIFTKYHFMTDVRVADFIESFECAVHNLIMDRMRQN